MIQFYVLGYLNNLEVIEMIIVEKSWLCIGDIVYFDEDGYLFIVDCMKEIIKYKGFQVLNFFFLFFIRLQ